MGMRHYNCDGCGEIVSTYDSHYTFNIDGFDIVCHCCGDNASDRLKLVEAPLLSFNFNKKTDEIVTTEHEDENEQDKIEQKSQINIRSFEDIVKQTIGEGTDHWENSKVANQYVYKMKDDYEGNRDSEWQCCSKFKNSEDFYEFISNLEQQLIEYCGLEDSNIKLELKPEDIESSLEKMNELINSLKEKQDCVLDNIKGKEKENDDVLVKLKEFNEKEIEILQSQNKIISKKRKRKEEKENEPKNKKEKF